MEKIFKTYVRDLQKWDLQLFKKHYTESLLLWQPWVLS